MPSNIIRFRETKEFKETIRRARSIIETNQSDLIRILCCLGIERLEQSFKQLETVSHPLKMSETEALASSLKIFVLRSKKQQLKDLKRDL